MNEDKSFQPEGMDTEQPAFAESQFKSENQQFQKDTLKKADPVKRAIALVIDALLSAIVSVIPFIGWAIGALYMLLRDALPIEALSYKSLGKKIMNLSVVIVDKPGVRLDYALSAKRNWMFALGPIITLWLLIPIIGWFFLAPLTIIAALVLGIIEIVKVFTDPKGVRLGDKMANTMVVED
jgi:hypothetical protein